MAEFYIPGTCFELSSLASHCLDVVIAIPVFNDCVLIVNFFQTYCHLVYLITRALELDILFTSAIVKTILAGIVFTSDVKTLCIDLDPTSQAWTLKTHSLNVQLVGLVLISVILCLISDRQLSFFSSAAIRHDVRHRLPFDSSSPRESSGFFWFTHSCNSSSVVPRSAPLRLTSRCLHGPSHAACGLAVLHTPSARCMWKSLTSCHQPSSFWVYSFLGVLHALLMIDLSSIIVFLSRFTRSSVASCNITRPVRGVSWSELATVPMRKLRRSLDLNFSWNSEEDIWKVWKKSNGTEKKRRRVKRTTTTQRTNGHAWMG